MSEPGIFQHPLLSLGFHIGQRSHVETRPTVNKSEGSADTSHQKYGGVRTSLQIAGSLLVIVSCF